MKNKILMASVLAVAASSAFAQAAPAAHPPAASEQAEHAPSTVTRAVYMQRSEKRFDKLDANKDGKLSADERHVNPQGRAAAPVTREEFMKRASLQFDERDTNKDGKLTPEERHAAHPGKAAVGNAVPVVAAKQSNPTSAQPAPATKH